MGLKRKINQYIDAGFPVLYINSFEDDKLDVMLKELGEGKDIVEWNAAKGLVDFETKTPQLVLSDDLSSVLNLFLDRDELERKIIVLKDIQSCINTPEIVAKIRTMANLINQGTDATVIIISAIVIIPPELEKFVTVLEMDYLTVKEIKALIIRFIEENQFTAIKDTLLDEFALAFKGLSEFEICNL